MLAIPLYLAVVEAWACVNPTAFGTAAAPSNATPVTISTCTWQSEYNTVTGVVAGATYQIGSSCGGYVTVRQGTPGGAVVAQGNAPLSFTATVTGTHYVHYNTTAACGTASVCCTTTITCTSCGGGGGSGCVNSIAFGTAAAPINSTPLTISTCTFQSEYNTITGVVAGATYQVGNSCGGYITVRQGVPGGAVVAQGNAPLSFTATVGGTYYVHYNTNAACGTASLCCTTTITCTSCAGSTGCVNTIAFGAIAAPTNATPVTISTCSFQNEYSTITGVVAGSTYNIGSSCGGYITVRQNTFNGPVAAQGNAPLVFVAPSSGTYFIHWNTNAACGTASSCCITTMACTSCTAPTGCVNTIPFGTASAPANTTPTTISTCSFQNEYSTITGMVAGETYVLGNSCGGYITVRQGVPNGPVAAAGPAPLSFIPLVGGTYHVHWNTNAACGTASNCCTTTITCTTCLTGGSGGIQIQQDLTPVQLITERFLGQCLTASNVSYTGANVAVGSFSNGWGIGIEEGIIITTGNALAALGPNFSDATSTTNASGGNTLLTNLAGQPTDDAAVFQFTFVPETDEVTFTYVFASEEYPEYVCSTFNDVFGFFISGPGYAANTNVAQIPGSTLPVAINTVNPGVVGTFGTFGGCTSLAYPGLYVNNVGGTHNEYDGFTVPLTVTITTVPCQAYTITIAVADAGDNSFDSAVFLKAESFSGGVELSIGTETDGAASSPVNCATEGAFVFTLDQPLAQALTLTYLVQQTGTAQYAPAIPVQVTFPAGSTQVVVPVSALPATLSANLSTVTITLDTSPYEEFGCTCEPSVEILTTTLYFCDPIALPVRWLSFDARPIAEERRVECQWRTASESNTASFTVERSMDLHHWMEVGSLPAGGHSTTTTNYLLNDMAPPRGTSYYRIRQNDLDGAFSHSEVRSVELDIPQLAVFPNPGAGVFTLQGHAGGEVRVMDMSGRQVPHHLDNAGALALINAAAGCYIVEVSWPTGAAPERVRLVVH